MNKLSTLIYVQPYMTIFFGGSWEILPMESKTCYSKIKTGTLAISRAQILSEVPISFLCVPVLPIQYMNTDYEGTF